MNIREIATKTVRENVYLNVSVLVERLINQEELQSELEELCFGPLDPESDSDDPGYLQIYEYWAVSDRLRDKLLAADEVVVEFCNMNIWGRTTSGQAIKMDGVIQDIAKELYDL
jgi:hypothetical protein